MAQVFTKVKEYKNLATCTPEELLKQSIRIRKSAEKWLKATGIMEIRTRKVEGLKDIDPDMPDEEKAEIRRENAKLIVAQRRKNLFDMLDAIMEKCPKETLEILALACFVEPEHVNDHSAAFYLGNFARMLANEDVLSFFTSLAQLAQTGILSM